MKYTIQLEATNRGKPTNKKVITNRKNLKAEIPQAWYDKEKKTWKYNQAGAILECGDLLPTKEQWEQIVEEYGLEELKKLLPMEGFRNYSDGSMYNQGSYAYYWSSSPLTSNGYNLYFNSTAVNPAPFNNRAYGFSVRCLKNLGKSKEETPEQVESETSDSSSLGLFDAVIERLREKKKDYEVKAKEIQGAIDIISSL